MMVIAIKLKCLAESNDTLHEFLSLLDCPSRSLAKVKVKVACNKADWRTNC